MANALDRLVIQNDQRLFLEVGVASPQGTFGEASCLTIGGSQNCADQTVDRMHPNTRDGAISYHGFRRGASELFGEWFQLDMGRIATSVSALYVLIDKSTAEYPIEGLFLRLYGPAARASHLGAHVARLPTGSAALLARFVRISTGWQVGAIDYPVASPRRLNAKAVEHFGLYPPE